MHMAIEILFALAPQLMNINNNVQTIKKQSPEYS